jgi:hypothetical protein
MGTSMNRTGRENEKSIKRTHEWHGVICHCVAPAVRLRGGCGKHRQCRVGGGDCSRATGNSTTGSGTISNSTGGDSTAVERRGRPVR